MDYPPTGFHFRVEFAIFGAGENDSRFQEVSGLTSELGIEEVCEGGENRFAHRLPARAKYGNLVLKRGVFTDSKLIDWFKSAVESFQFEPVDVLVTLLNADHEPLVGWSFVGAWPVKWVTSDLKAQENALAIETVELVYRFMRRV